MEEESIRPVSDVESVITDTTRDSQESTSPFMSHKFPLLMMRQKNRKYPCSNFPDDQFSPVIPCSMELDKVLKHSRSIEVSPQKRQRTESDEESEKSESILTYKKYLPIYTEDDRRQIIADLTDELQLLAFKAKISVAPNLSSTQYSPTGSCPSLSTALRSYIVFRNTDPVKFSNPETCHSQEQTNKSLERRISNTSPTFEVEQNKKDIIQNKVAEENGGIMNSLSNSQETRLSDDGAGGHVSLSGVTGCCIQYEALVTNKKVSCDGSPSKIGEADPSGGESFVVKSGGDIVRDEDGTDSLDISARPPEKEKGKAEPEDSQMFDASQSLFTDTQNSLLSLGYASSTCTNDLELNRPVQGSAKKASASNEKKVSSSNEKKVSSSNEINVLVSSSNERCLSKEDPFTQTSSSSRESFNLTQEIADLKSSQNNSEKMQVIFTKIQRIQTSMLRKIQHGDKVTVESEVIAKARKRHSVILHFLKTLTEIQRNERFNLSVKIKHKKNSKAEAIKLKNQFQSLTDRQKQLVRLYKMQEEIEQILCKLQKDNGEKHNDMSLTNTATREKEINFCSTQGLATPVSRNMDLNEDQGDMTPFQCIAAKWMNAGTPRNSALFTPKRFRPQSSTDRKKTPCQSVITQKMRSLSTPRLVMNQQSVNRTGSGKQLSTYIKSPETVRCITENSIPIAETPTSCPKRSQQLPINTLPNTNLNATDIVSENVTPSSRITTPSIPTVAHVTPVSAATGRVSTNQKLSMHFKSPPLSQMISKTDREISPSTACSSDVFPVKSSELIRRHQQRLAASQIQSQIPSMLGKFSDTDSQHFGGKVGGTGTQFQNKEQITQGHRNSQLVGTGEDTCPKVIGDAISLPQNNVKQINLLPGSHATPVRRKPISTAIMRKRLPFSVYVDENVQSESIVENMTENNNGHTQEMPVDVDRHDVHQENKLKYPALESLIQDNILLPAHNALSVTVEGKMFRASLLENGKIQTIGGEVLKTPVQWLNAVLGGESVKKGRAYKEILYAGNSLKSYIDGESCVTQSSLEEYLTSVEAGPKESAKMVDSESQTEATERTRSRIPQSKISDLLHDCKIRLLSEMDLVPCTDLPENFWTNDFKDVKLTENLWKEVDCWM